MPFQGEDVDRQEHQRTRRDRQSDPLKDRVGLIAQMRAW
jgi:hypothetical protein